MLKLPRIGTGKVLRMLVLEWEQNGALCLLGLSSGRVAAMKHTMEHLLANTLINDKPTINYAELCTLLSRAASVVNDRPVGIKSLTEDELVPHHS